MSRNYIIEAHNETEQSILESSCDLAPYEAMKVTQAIFKDRVKEATLSVFHKIREFQAYLKCTPLEAADAIIAKGNLKGTVLSWIILGTACKLSFQE